MSQIKGKDTKPELIVRKYLFSRGFRFRVHDKRYPGKPDIVLPKYLTVIQVQGCFWHGHSGCKNFKIPKTRTEWWKTKIERNRINDIKNESRLRKLGWKVITVWECELKGDRKCQTLIDLESEILNH